MKGYFFVLLILAFSIFPSYAYSAKDGYFDKLTDGDDLIVTAINNASESISNKRYDMAVYWFEKALDINERESSYHGCSFLSNSQIQEIKKDIEYCKYKIDHPDDNPFYKKEIGWFEDSFSTLRTITAYGINSSISFLDISDISGSNHIIVTKSNLIQLQSILAKCVDALTYLNNKKIRRKRIPTLFPISINLLYSTLGHAGYMPTVFIFEVAYSKAERNYAIMIYRENESWPLLGFKAFNDLVQLKYIFDDAETKFRTSKPEKVKDDDFILKRLEISGKDRIH